MKRDDDWLVTAFEPERWSLSTDPAQVDRIVAEVRHRRRRRLAIRSGSGVLAVALVTAAAVAVVNSDLVRNAPAQPVQLLTQPQTTGPLPEPVTKSVAGLDELVELLPGITVTERDLGSFDPVRLVDQATLLGVIERDGKPELALLDLPSGDQIPVARLDRSFVDAAWLDDDYIVWMETEHVDVDASGGYRPEELIVRCFDRATAQTSRLRIPAADPAGMPFPTTWGFGEVALGGGRIVVSMHLETTGPSGSFVEVNNLYVAQGCGDDLELLAAHAGYPEVSGQWLYYLHSPDGTDGIWRQKLSGSEPEPIAAPAGLFALTGDAVVWDETRVGALTSTVTLHAARLDGSHARVVPSSRGWQLGLEGSRSAVFGFVLDPDSQTFDYQGWWLYVPSLGAIVTGPPPDAAPGATMMLDGHGAGADQLLFIEDSGHGVRTGRILVVSLP
ncbi:MAG: hypothetical protein L0Y54_08890 [Sporichthyaceae bacterium]|nr:hypothetical protein [Sporichthyaceae bacterium]